MAAWNRRAWSVAVASLALAGCAGIAGRGEPVSVTVSDLRMGTASVLEQQYFVTLRIQNPNDHELAVNGVVFDLELNGKSFARGTTGQSVTVPRFSTATVEVETLSTLGGILRQLGDVAGGSLPQQMRYRIKGRLYQEGRGATLPFDDRGELTMPGSAGTR
jgi:LEA14-like dessication related protein